MYYLLDENKKPYKVNDVIEWGKKLVEEMRTVKQENIGKYYVSTVFLGIDHSCKSNIPILFETMIFGGIESGEYQERYATYEEALEGHEKAVMYVKSLKK